MIDKIRIKLWTSLLAKKLGHNRGVSLRLSAIFVLRISALSCDLPVNPCSCAFKCDVSDLVDIGLAPSGGLTCTPLRALLSSPCGSPGDLSVGSLGRCHCHLCPLCCLSMISTHLMHLTCLNGSLGLSGGHGSLPISPVILVWALESRHPQPDLRSGLMEVRREFGLVLQTPVFYGAANAQYSRDLFVVMRAI